MPTKTIWLGLHTFWLGLHTFIYTTLFTAQGRVQIKLTQNVKGKNK